MASLRTAAQIQAEYDAVHAAYLKAVQAASHSLSAGDTTHSITYQRIDSLRKELNALEKEYQSVSRGGITIQRAVPIDS